LAARLFAPTWLAVALGAALGSSAALAANPLPLALIGALVPAQDEDTDAEVDTVLAQDESADAETAQGEEATSEDADAAAVEEESEAPSDEVAPDTDESAQDESSAAAADDVAPEETPEAAAPEPTPTPQPAAPAPITPSERSAGTNDAEDTTMYNVVINHEEQYSIWPAGREIPLGWTNVGAPCRKSECLARIKDVWTDMRPLSLRKKMEEAANGGQ
jgi:MbtH protein